MSRIDRNQQMLNWLTKERIRDDVEEKLYKEKIVREIKKVKKSDLFPEPKKLSLWQKLRIIILGN